MWKTQNILKCSGILLLRCFLMTTLCRNFPPRSLVFLSSLCWAVHLVCCHHYADHIRWGDVFISSIQSVNVCDKYCVFYDTLSQTMLVSGIFPDKQKINIVQFVNISLAYSFFSRLLVEYSFSLLVPISLYLSDIGSFVTWVIQYCSNCHTFCVLLLRNLQTQWLPARITDTSHV